MVNRNLLGPAVGLLIAGLILWLHTFQALGLLPFAPTVETQQTFFAWTFAMIAGPVVVMLSAALLALSADAGEDPGPAAGAAHGLALLATTILAARVWENVEGFLIPNDAPAAVAGTPLPLAKWPFVYHSGWWLFGGAAAVAVLIAAYAAWRGRPRLIPLAMVAVAVVAIVVAGGSFGFAAMSFFRLRNWAIVVAIIDAFAIASRWRRFAPRSKSAGLAAALQILLLVVIVAEAWQLHGSWTALRAEMPRDVPAPWW